MQHLWQDQWQEHLEILITADAGDRQPQQGQADAVGCKAGEAALTCGVIRMLAN